jgi:hypothetical protein
MKNIYLLIVMALTFASCTVDENEDLFAQKNSEEAVLVKAEEVKVTALSQPESSDCFDGLAAHINLNVSAGLNNPVINFIADAPANVSAAAKYIVNVEIQPLSDCDDFSSSKGDATNYGNATEFSNVASSQPSVSLLPSQLPVCYKWRMKFKGTSGAACEVYSPWYEAPLF